MFPGRRVLQTLDLEHPIPGIVVIEATPTAFEHLHTKCLHFDRTYYRLAFCHCSEDRVKVFQHTVATMSNLYSKILLVSLSWCIHGFIAYLRVCKIIFKTFPS